MTELTAEQKARYRPFRGAAWALYLVVAVGFSVLVIYSVFASVLRMTPARPETANEALPVSQCARRARTLFDELDAQRQAHTQGRADEGDHRFLAFRTEWLGRERRLEADCLIEQADRHDLRALFGTLNTLLDEYTTESVQYANATGPTVERFRSQLTQLE